MSDSCSEQEDKKAEWRRRVTEMRERFQNRVDENTVEGKRDGNLYHGLKLVSSTMMLGKFEEICYCEESHEYLVIDSPSNVLRYSVQGKPIQPSYALSATMLFSKLLWCHEAKVLIGYVPNDDMMWLMTSFCMLYQAIRNEFRISNIFYEPSTNEAIVAGPNKVTRFSLVNKETTMNSSKTMSYIDSEYGALWKLECTCFIPASTLTVRMAGSYMTTLYVLPLEPSKEKEDTVPVMFLARNPSATESSITTMLFQITSQWIITGDDQGNVMGWDLELNSMMSCRHGHNRSVRLIAPHPSICGFITFAEDDVLQIWSCNLRGKMESFSEIGDIWGIAINESAAAIATLGQRLSCFNMHQLYTFYGALSESAIQIISTMHPMYSTRVIVRSADNTIRILTSPTGRQTNLQILPNTLDLVSMAYSGSRERLYTIILKTGEVLVSNTRMNPMELRHVWVADDCVVTCITAYEYYEEILGPDRRPQKPRIIYPKHTLIFVGTTAGDIININESSGKHQCRFSGHKGPVTKLWSSTISKLVLSVGEDKCIKVWGVYPILAVPLALAHSIYYTVPITHIVTIGSVMCMVSSTPASMTHQLFMYDMVETVRLDHHPSKNHTNLILDIAASESLQICATSSMDNTIRLWDHQNIPIKVLEINTSAYNIAFSSLRGDIVFGAGRHVYRISYQNYLSPKYRARILVNEIPEEMEEGALPENKEYRIYENLGNRELLLHPVSSVPLGSLDISDGDAPRLDVMVQQQMCAQLQRRDQDIMNIREGEIKAVKLVAEKSLMNHEAWKKYLEDLLGTSKKTSTEVPPHDIWALIEKYKTVKRFYNKPGIFRMLYGFLNTFANISVFNLGYSIEKFPEYPDAIPDHVQYPRLPLFGFLPNSVIYKLFGDEDREPPPPLPKPKQLLKYEYPDEFLMAQLHLTGSDTYEANVELSPSQLLNMTRLIESETTVNRVAIPEDQSPFVRMARDAQRGHNSTNEKPKSHRVQHNGFKKRNMTRTKKIKRKVKARSSGIPSTVKEIVHARDERLIGKISSEKFLNQRSLGNIKKALYRNMKGKQSSKHVLNLGENSNTTCKQTKVYEFKNIDDLSKMSLKQIISEKKGIKQIIRNEYRTVSKVHDEKIKDVIMMLLAKCVNTPSLFSVIFKFLDILSSEDIGVIAFVCAIFTVTTHRVVRKSIKQYLKNHGLRYPQKILVEQLLVVKNATNTSNIFVLKNFMTEMIRDWMDALKKHVGLVANNIRHNNSLRRFLDWILKRVIFKSFLVIKPTDLVRSFIRKGVRSFAVMDFKTSYNSHIDDFIKGTFAEKIDSICKTSSRHHTEQDSNCVISQSSYGELVVSPIEGINYFCELNSQFSRTVCKVQKSSRARSNR